MKLLVHKGVTSYGATLFLQDSSSTTGGGATGLNGTMGTLSCYYARWDQGNAAATQISLVSGTKGTWASGALVEKDSANMPGVYEFGVPNACLATGASFCVIMLKAAAPATVAPLALEFQLTDWDPQDANLGMTGVGVSSNIKKNQALNGFTFTMTDSTNHNPSTGLSVTAQRSLDGASFAPCANAVSEITNGDYKINLAAADLNANVVMLRFSATATDDLNILLVTQP